MEQVFRESETVEFKKSTSELKEGIVSIVAMLNKHGRGEVYFGVGNDGRAIGQQVSDSTLRVISQAISEGIEPKVYPEIKEAEFEGRKCVHVVFSGSEAPYFAFGRAYSRVGTENRPLSAKELEKIIIGRNTERLQWDRGICWEARLHDISQRKVKAFLKKAGLSFDSVENALRKLKLFSDGKLLNAAVILFAKKPESFFQNARLRCAVFATATTENPLDMQEHYGDLFWLIEKSEKYILGNIHIGMRLEGLYRVDVPEIDKSAFREAIINAFCHRDYCLYDSVNIAVFRDRVEIRSPGLLYGGLTIEQIKREEVSERRNEIIAEMFHKVHFIEKWGRGIGLILSKEPTADFKEVGRQFITVFQRKNVPENVLENVPENRLERILGLVAKNNRVPVPMLAKKLGVTEKTIKRDIAKLKQKGLLRRVGPDKGGHWEVVEGLL